ncbi:MAG: efflux transporter outer membrane subunit [Magnetococcus sp. YQC-5]
MRHFHFKLFLLLSLWLTGCTFGPDYQTPFIHVPHDFKEGPGWKLAEPKAHLPRGDWWKIFGDPVLDCLQERVTLNNQNLKMAEARYRQAQARAEMAGAVLYPTLSGNLGMARGQTSNAKAPVTTRTLGLNVSWELDLWGRVQRGTEAEIATAQAEMSDLEAARLSLHAQMAQNYFLLRVAEQQSKLYSETLTAYEQFLTLTRHQHDAGLVTSSDVAQAENQLFNTKAQALDIELQRRQLEHVLAQLVGRTPADFDLAPALLPENPPEIPSVLPAEMLERRPDVAVAERRVAVANAQIGVAEAAFFPTLSLGLAGGYQGTIHSGWFDSPARFWSLGPTLAATLFDGGLRQAEQQQALAVYDQAVAFYRQTVLNAMQEVEDTLATVRLLDGEIVAQNGAVKAARQAQALTENQYQAGMVSHLALITTQAAALASERAALSLRGRRYTAVVTLIKALGGDWHKMEKKESQRQNPGG